VFTRVWAGKQLLAGPADNLGMPASIQQHTAPIPFCQCPVCRGTDVIGAVEGSGRASPSVTFHPYYRICGYAERGVLVDSKDDCASSVPLIFTRWLYPARREPFSAPVDESPREWTCLTCGSSQVAFGDCECRACALCGVNRFIFVNEAN
jgi:hypothetical protein